jgi:hypothetical protein
LTNHICVYTKTLDVGRPPKPADLRRSQIFPLRLTPGEMVDLEKASRKLKEPIAGILRKGAALYVHLRGKGGSRAKGEKKR